MYTRTLILFRISMLRLADAVDAIIIIISSFAMSEDAQVYRVE